MARRSRQSQMNPTAVVIIVLSLVLLGLLIAGIVYACKDTNNAPTSAPNREPFAPSKEYGTVVRPDHPSWYKDIPEDHPEVLDLVKQTAQQSKRVPTFTPKGFERRRMPDDVYKYLLDVAKTTNRVREDKNNIFRRTSSGLPPYLLPIPQEKKNWIHQSLKSELEKWSGIKLKPTSAYGPREYRRGSSLRMHVDTETTHIISAILHINSENLDEDWPLVVINRDGKRENVHMKPGDMILYESASLPHSRELPLKGDYYVNMFIHYEPEDYEAFKEMKKNWNK